MKTYIFANCKKNEFNTYSKNLQDKVPKDARLVILNRGAVYYKVPMFKEYKNQVLMMRKCMVNGISGFFGLETLADDGVHVPLFQEIIGVDPGDTTILTIGHKDKTSEIKKIATPWVTEYNKITGKEVTTGYAAYYLVQDLYGEKPEDIYLVNFYGNNDKSTGKWYGHAWDYEDKWLKDKQRIYC